MEDIAAASLYGIGKPEPLKYDLQENGQEESMQSIELFTLYMMYNRGLYILYEIPLHQERNNIILILKEGQLLS